MLSQTPPHKRRKSLRRLALCTFGWRLLCCLLVLPLVGVARSGLAQPRPTALSSDAPPVRREDLLAGASVAAMQLQRALKVVTYSYTVRPGETLYGIAKKEKLQVDWRFIVRLNNLQSTDLETGQGILLVRGPFHAKVLKSTFRLQLLLEHEEGTINVGSFVVGLGENHSTPVGRFVVRPRSKVVNPGWVNPRTQEVFDRDTPDIPIGEYWLGLMGTTPETRDLKSYGIHGTNEPLSIGKNVSMGCIRMLEPELALVYEVLSEGRSQVEIRP